jgi:DNA-binding transcriptional LysR family regulator
MKLSTDVLREYVALSEHKSFVAAAKVLYMSSSTLNRHIIELEKCTGRKLFIRSRPGAFTHAGRIMLDAAAEILYQENRLVKKLEELNCALDDTIKVSAHPSFIGLIDFYSVAISRLAKSNPDITIRFHALPENAEVVSAVLKRSTEVCNLIRHGSRNEILSLENDKVGYLQPFCLQRPMGIYTEPGHRLAGNSVSIRELERERILVPTSAHYRDYKNEVERLCRSYGFTPRFDFRDTSSYLDLYLQPLKGGIFLQMVEVGDKFILPTTLSQNESLVVTPLEEDIWGKPLLVYRADALNESLAIFLETLLAIDEENTGGS